MNKEELEKNIGYVFKNNTPHFASFVFVGLTAWEFFNRMISGSVKLIINNRDLVTKVYIPKYILLLSKSFTYSNLKEGEMTKGRASVVCETSLHKVAKKHNFSDFLNLGKSEKKTCKEGRPAILADSVEAVIAAMYIDGGLEPAKKFIIENLKDDIEIAVHHVGEKDYKTVLQEMLQVHGNVKIEYNVLREFGPDHAKQFEVEVRCNSKLLAKGIGTSKKSAEMQAAKKAIEISLEKNNK